MANYTALTVFENSDTLNEPVIALPMFGRLSFRQIGLTIGLAVLLPMMIYSGMSSQILAALPNPLFTFDSVTGSGHIHITWDVILALLPVPVGLALGIPRPKLMSMDELIMALVLFAIHHTSIKEKKTKKVQQDSKFVGFAKQDAFTKYKKSPKKTFAVNVASLGTPKNITITLHDTKGNPIRNTLARAYVDDVLLCTITTDFDGIMGMTFAPQSEGIKNLKILADGIDEPVVDVEMDVKVRK